MAKYWLQGVLVGCVFVAMQNQAVAQDWMISSNTVEALKGDLSSVHPPVLTPADASDYLDDDSALGYHGPLGPYGPLGILGPVGDNIWNASYWISAIGDWSAWSDELTELGGPLSELGPLGPNGPLSQQAYDVDLPAINDFGKQLQVGGVWTALGPVGPLGALGPLGPLGPIGAHGLGQNSYGQYVQNGYEIRSVEVPYAGSVRSYELYEKYDERFAREKTDNDTSFMVKGYIAYPYSQTDRFEFQSQANQAVTIVLTPVAALDDFDFIVKDEVGKVIAVASTYDYVDFVQLNNVAQGEKLTVEVRLHSTAHYLTKDYRLFVTGSTPYVSTAVPITGNHQFMTR